jgi:hypothetical protein
METTDLHIIDPTAVRLFRHAGALCVTLEGDRSYRKVAVVRAFPLSEPDRFWGLLDGAGKEIGVIADPERLETDSRALAEEELKKRYFIPVVERVVRTREDHGSIVWTVRTNKGDCTFVVRNMKDSIVELGGSRLLLVDVDGNRYEVPDIKGLDSKSFDLILRSQ